MLKIAYPHYAFLYVLIVLLVGLYLYARYRRKKCLEKFGDINIITSLIPYYSSKKVFYKNFLLWVALFLAITGLINPQSGSKIEKIKKKSAEIMICLDVSNSMYAEDIKPNRIERAKQAISKLIDKLEGDNIGLVIFAGKPFVQLPITSDYSAAKMFVSTVSPELIDVQGTAIGEALYMAAEAFKEENVKKRNRAIIVISDGENHQDDAIAAASEIAKQGITIHTIGMGSPEGAPIPIYSGNNISYKKDKEGNTIITRLNEALLQKIAAVGNGVYVRATTVDVGLNTIFEEINKLEKEESETRVYSEYEDHFQIFVLFSLILLIIEIIIFERKIKWKKGLSIFKPIT